MNRENLTTSSILEAEEEEEMQANDAELLFPALMRFSLWYQGVHGYVSVALCVFGIASNLTNIVVLTQKTMLTPTNHLLTALAIADALTMTSYLPYAVYFNCLSIPDETYGHPKAWVFYLLFNFNFTITTHTIAMWLTVSMAVFRYIVVCHHVLGPRLCNLHRARMTIASVFVVTPLVCLPNYVKYRIYERETGGYWFYQNVFVGDVYKTFNFWLFAVILKVAPCVLLAALSALLIRAMRRADRKRRRLKSLGRRIESERANEHCRTTAMLVAVVLCFVLAELPQGVLAFLSGVDAAVFEHVYVPLGDVWDLLGLANSAVNFVLYCAMSRKFRKTFKDVCFNRCRNSMRPPGNRTMSTRAPASNCGDVYLSSVLS